MQMKLMRSERLLLLLVASTLAVIAISAVSRLSHSRPSALRDSMSTLPQFTQQEGEMKVGAAVGKSRPR
eukprot:766995-Hanusia_phi.AAC.3